MGAEEKEYIAIRDFLLAAKDDIRYLVTEHLKTLILTDFKDLTEQFYQGLEVVDRGIHSAIIQLKEAKYEYLQDHGLTGIELKRKLSIYYRAREVKVRYSRLKPSRFAIGLMRSFFRRFIAVIDVVLDSLAQVLPPLGAVKEFKDSLTAVI